MLSLDVDILPLGDISIPSKFHIKPLDFANVLSIGNNANLVPIGKFNFKYLGQTTQTSSSPIKKATCFDFEITLNEANE